MRKQKMAIDAGALISGAIDWDSIDWNLVQRAVRRLQMRIAKTIINCRVYKGRLKIALLDYTFPKYQK